MGQDKQPEGDTDIDMAADVKVILHDPIKPMHPLVWRAMIISLVFIYSSYTMFIHLAEEDGKIPFSSASMVLLTEVLKLSLSVGMFLSEGSLISAQLPSWRVALPYAVPALLYTFNNNIGVHMQTQMDPATYQVLCNLKILSTAFLYRLIIKKPISGLQWVALSMLALAGICNSYGGMQAKSGETSAGVIHITIKGLCMIAVYSTVSGLAGVYTEYILKGKYDMSIHMQNGLLYVYCVFLNGLTWLVDVITSNNQDQGYNFFHGFSTYTWLLIISQALCGLIMSAVMKHGSNITRLFIISCAMLVTTVLSVLIFNLQLNVYFCSSFLLVLLALYLYHHN